MMYGATGSLEIPMRSSRIAGGVPNKGVLVFGVVFIVAGLAFKLGAAPSTCGCLMCTKARPRP